MIRKVFSTAALIVFLSAGCADLTSTEHDPAEALVARKEQSIEEGGIDDGENMIKEAENEEAASPGEEGMQSVDFVMRIENLSPKYEFLSSGLFDTPTDVEEPGPLGSGAVYEFTFSAHPGSRLSFATMYVQSNDLFYAPGPAGIPLYSEADLPISGNVTRRIFLWDAGTERNEKPGFGANQAPRQPAPNTGPDEDGLIVPMRQDYTYPQGGNHISVNLEALGESRFRVRIQNIAMDPAMLLSPGVWVVHSDEAPLFTRGQPDRGEGLEALAEDGDPSALAASLARRSGIPMSLSPGVWAVFKDGQPIFSEGEQAPENGLEALAEDGAPGALSATLGEQEGVKRAGTFTTPSGAQASSQAGPGSTYEFSFQASPGDRLTFATMFVPSHDLFFAPAATGVALFDDAGSPRMGEITQEIFLWDAGTEINQGPGLGADQAPRQEAPDTGTTERGVVSQVGDPTISPRNLLRVTLHPGP